MVLYSCRLYINCTYKCMFTVNAANIKMQEQDKTDRAFEMWRETVCFIKWSIYLVFSGSFKPHYSAVKLF